MKTYHLHSELWLPEKRERVFKFFADPANLERITPTWLRFVMVTDPAIRVTEGTLLDYRLKLHGFPLRWQSEITIWQPPYRFVDRQTKGPYSRWVHEHTFIDDGGGTLVRDDVEYAVLGRRLIQKLLVAPDLTRIFAYRQEALRKIFNATGAPTVVRSGLS